tara:strand:- start:36246 stop:37001 length:756 start_codon:yes stop_codon:yes gene_type:complete
MKKKQKLLSLITVVKNDVLNIEKTIKSVLRQKGKDVEFIVIDGKSSDGTIKIIKKYKNKIDKVVIEKDRGIYYAMNKGIKFSTGKYIGFCNSGDLINKGGIKIIVNHLKNDTDVLFATVKRHYLGKTVIKSGYNLLRLNYNFDFATSHSTGFYIKSKFHKVLGLYDISFKCSSDYDFYYRLLKNNKINIMSTPKNKIVGIVQKGGFSSTLSPIDHLNEETKIRVKNKQNFILILIIYINSLIKIFLKKIST